MLKLTAADLQRRSVIDLRFQSAKAEIEAKIAVVTAAVDGMNTAIDAYNEVVDEATALRDDIVAAQEEYIGERSEKWQEGEKGEAYVAWKDEWESLDFTAVEKVDVDDAIIDVDDLDHEETLNDAPETPE